MPVKAVGGCHNGIQFLINIDLRLFYSFAYSIVLSIALDSSRFNLLSECCSAAAAAATDATRPGIGQVVLAISEEHGVFIGPASTTNLAAAASCGASAHCDLSAWLVKL